MMNQGGQEEYNTDTCVHVCSPYILINDEKSLDTEDQTMDFKIRDPETIFTHMVTDIQASLLSVIEIQDH